MKKRTKITYIACFLVAIFIFSACSLFNIDYTLDTPLIYSNETEKYIWWQSVKYAESYDVYLNDTKIQSVTTNSNVAVYDYSKVCTKEGTNYAFKVRSIANGYAGEFSNTVNIFIDSKIENDNEHYSLSCIETDNQKGVSGVAVNSQILSWNTVNNAKGYVLAVYSNTDGYNFYYTEGVAVKLSNIKNTNSDILAIKVAAVYENDDIIYVKNDGLVYYNPISQGEFTDKSAIYLFDGKINDKYISSDEELRNYAYYNFVNRNDEYILALSNKYKNEILAEGEIISTHLQNVIDNAYLETYSYITNLPQIKALTYDSVAYVYKVTWVFKGDKQCKLKNVDKNTGIGTGISSSLGWQQYDMVPYYERLDYESRDASYDSFASDDKFLSVAVETSEQLFWAIEGGYTPIPKASSRADFIYKYAKATLNSILSNNMTDYEKALCIHDWLCDNYVYDHYSLESQSVNMNLTCYYLESIFLDTNKMVVCDGYAKAFSMLCNMEGIDCIRITGTLSGQGHAWNKVKIDDIWYIVDVTNTEIKATLAEDGTTKSQEFLAHELFLVSEDDVNYEAFENRARNFENTCDDNYHYYSCDDNDTVLLIANKEDLYAFLDYTFAYNFGSFDVAISLEYLTELMSNSTEYPAYKNFDVVMTQYYQTKTWLTEMPGYIIDGNQISHYVKVEDSKLGVVMTFRSIKLDINSMTEEQQQAYNTFVEEYMQA